MRYLEKWKINIVICYSLPKASFYVPGYGVTCKMAFLRIRGYYIGVRWLYCGLDVSTETIDFYVFYVKTQLEKSFLVRMVICSHFFQSDFYVICKPRWWYMGRSWVSLTLEHWVYWNVQISRCNRICCRRILKTLLASYKINGKEICVIC